MVPPNVEFRILPLTRGLVAYVSPHRFEELSRFKWFARWNPTTKGFYAVRKSHRQPGKKDQRELIYMHRQILGLRRGDSMTVDHVDPSRTLDNTDDNLRIADRTEQSRNHRIRKDNSSGYKGVRSHARTGKWMAAIGVDGKRIYLGLFDTPEDAHHAYAVAVAKYHGEYGRVA
jgi:hypothetical protein